MSELSEKRLDSIEELLKMLLVNDLSNNNLEERFLLNKKEDIKNESFENQNIINEFYCNMNRLMDLDIIFPERIDQGIQLYIIERLIGLEYIRKLDEDLYITNKKRSKEKVLVVLPESGKYLIEKSLKQVKKLKSEKIDNIIFMIGPKPKFKIKKYIEIPYLIYSISMEDFISYKKSYGKLFLSRFEPIIKLNGKFDKIV